MREKQVVCIKNGAVLGLVGDVEVDTCSGKLINIIVYGRRRFLGRDDDCRIPWESIEVIGEDSILVNFENSSATPKRRNIISEILFSK
jgi:YlmC/YmxH family sporulation protein